MVSRRVISASVVLGRIYKDNDAIAGLAAYYSVPESTIHRVVDGLIEQGYLTRLPPGGGAQYRLTGRGSALVQGQANQEVEAKANAYSHTGKDLAHHEHISVNVNHIVKMTGDDSDES
jgi:DNA-binding IclR family transcriptional regulator